MIVAAADEQRLLMHISPNQSAFSPGAQAGSTAYSAG